VIDRFVLAAKNKNTVSWKLINRENVNFQQMCNIIINNGDDIITNPRIVLDRFIFSTDVIKDLLSQNNYHCLNPGEVARGIFFSSWHISWNYNQTVHIPFATFLPLS